MTVVILAEDGSGLGDGKIAGQGMMLMEMVVFTADMGMCDNSSHLYLNCTIYYINYK